MSKFSAIAWLLLAASAEAQDLADPESAPPNSLSDLVRYLQTRVEKLEAERDLRARAPATSAIDLSGEELPQVPTPDHDHVLARPWYENLTISGYGAFTYLDTGATGTAPDGSFLVKEASLFLDAEIWERTSLFSEIVLARFPGNSPVRLGEINLQFSNLFSSEDEPGIGMKVGRFEIPFGEEYFRWDANETPFITLSAADPYGVDEGVELYGALGGVDWIAAVTNGSDGSGPDDGSSKLVAAKLSGNPHSDFYLSGSALVTGDTALSAFRLSGNSLAPVGTGGASAAGLSPSANVDTTCWELDCRLFQERDASVALNFGQGKIQDMDPFDRGLLWWQVLPRLKLSERVEALLRYSEIRTDDADEGYRFSGKPIAQGETLGYDTHSLRRLSAALCWAINPHLVGKFEIGHDWFDLIDASALDGENNERLYFGLEVVASF